MESGKEIISSLKFIGKLQKGDKINTKFMYRQPDGLPTRISRTFINQDNRHNTINFIQNSREGLVNLKETYACDLKFCCDMDTILQTIHSKLKEVDSKID